MKNTPSFINGIIELKCPRCRQGNLFLHGPYSGKHLDMPKNCPNCQQQYEIETGFFWGAMYITYALVSAIFIFFLIIFFVFEIKWYIIGGIYIATVIVLIPVLVRYSRALMLYTFASISFDPKLFQKNKSDH